MTSLCYYINDILIKADAVMGNKPSYDMAGTSPVKYPNTNVLITDLYPLMGYHESTCPSDMKMVAERRRLIDNELLIIARAISDHLDPKARVEPVVLKMFEDRTNFISILRDVHAKKQ